VSHRTDASGDPPELLISVVEIRRRPGSRLPVEQRLEAHGLGLPDVAVPDGAEIAFDGELESIHEGVVLTGRARVPWSGSCRRCLLEVGGVAELEVREVYETKPTDGETWPLVHDHVDLGPLLRDVALLALPLAPLCGDDCLGPAPEAFPATVAADPAVPAADDEAPKDPRWAALDDLQL
jgi:uncharacterized protein